MEKPIVFKNKRGKQLMGILHLPEGKKKFPLIVICHGFGGDKTRREFVRLARDLEKNKIATFRFDFEGCGDSEGKLEKTTVRKQVSDLETVINLILKQKNINKNKIVFLGHSLGCLIAAFFIKQSKFPIKTLVFWAPGFNQKALFPIWNTKNDLKKWRRQGYFIRKDKKFGISYLKENEKKDYTPLFSQIQVPILIVHGQKDETVPIRFSRQLAQKYKNIKLIILPKADHKFEDYYSQKKLIKETVRWLRHFLKNSGKRS
ncbi:alpha/beta fold hydrolase [Patescibacteria group bacterium]|nr:alpha/beta fold hydrolase [Patescibacteria group bacterium]